MKKHGFTLAEVLISLGIVAIVAALAAPSLLNIMPDKSKLKVIKAHKILSDVTSEMLNNPALYRDLIQDIPSTNDAKRTGLNSSVDFYGEEFPVLFDKAGNIENYRKKYHGGQKYCYLLSENLELNNEVKQNGNKYSFDTIDGINWTCEFVTTPSVDIVENGITYKYMETTYTITIDIDGPNKGENSIAKSGVKRPDQFQFQVDNFGKVTGVDTLTKNYLKNNMKLSDRKNDYDNTGM